MILKNCSNKLTEIGQATVKAQITSFICKNSKRKVLKSRVCYKVLFFDVRKTF